MARRDHLERAVLECLWEHSGGLTAPEVVDLLADRQLALTTVHTVLERLRGKGMVQRERDGRVFRHRAARTREEVTAEAMLAVLQDSTSAGDRGLALSMFARSVSAADAEALRQALGEPGAAHAGPDPRLDSPRGDGLLGESGRGGVRRSGSRRRKA